MPYDIFDTLITDHRRFASDCAQSAAVLAAGNLIAAALRGRGMSEEELADRLGVDAGVVTRMLAEGNSV
jgi:ribosome-binding protein aMBF1 (putative translation factor)